MQPRFPDPRLARLDTDINLIGDSYLAGHHLIAPGSLDLRAPNPHRPLGPMSYTLRPICNPTYPDHQVRPPTPQSQLPPMQQSQPSSSTSSLRLASINHPHNNSWVESNHQDLISSHNQGNELLASQRTSMEDKEWHNEVKMFGMSMNQLMIESTKARLKRFASRTRDMIERHQNLIEKPSKSIINEIEEEEFCACISPIETFIGIPKMSRKKHFYKYLDKGDLLCVKIVARSETGFICLVMCMDGGKRRDINDCDIKVFCPMAYCQPLSVTHSEFQDGYQVKDLLRVVVTNYIMYEMKIIVSMKEEHLPQECRGKFKMGLINDDDLPVHFRRQISMKSTNYDEMLRKTLSFQNPGATTHLSNFFELPSSQRLSFLKAFHSVEYPDDEYAKYLRKIQSQKLAKQSVEEGVKYLKSGSHIEAHQCLNKALQVDPDNLDALVARGCLFANTNNLPKAAEDFDKVLAIDTNHVNARKYMSETLFELGKIYEEKGDLEGATVKYRRACQINIKNVDALEALKAVNEKKGIQHSHDDSSKSFETNLTRLTESNDRNLSETSHKLKLLLEEDKKKKSSKKKKRRRNSSSSSSSPSSSSSSSSSSESSYSSSNSSSSSSSDYDSKRKSRKKRRRSKKSRSKTSKRKKKDSKRKKKRASSKETPSKGLASAKRNSKLNDGKKVDANPSTSSRIAPKKQSPKVFFVLKKPEIKTLAPTKPFASPSPPSSVREKIVYNLDKLKPVPIEFVRNTPSDKTENDNKPPKRRGVDMQNRAKMYIPGRSRSRSRSRSGSRERRLGMSSYRRSRSNSRSRTRSRPDRGRSPPFRRRSRSRGRYSSPRKRSPLRDKASSPASSWRDRRDSSRDQSSRRNSTPIICRAPDPQDLKNRTQDKLKRVAEEAKKVEALVGKNTDQEQDNHGPVPPKEILESEFQKFEGFLYDLKKKKATEEPTS